MGFPPIKDENGDAGKFRIGECPDAPGCLAVGVCMPRKRILIAEDNELYRLTAPAMGRGWQRVSQCHIFLQHPGITSTLFSIYGRPCRWYTGYAKICLWDSHSKTINWNLAS